MIEYKVEDSLELREFIDILIESGLSKRRPMENQDLLNRMLCNSNLMISARVEGKLVGFLRALSDFSYRTFIADLAVVETYQNQGIGRRLLTEARKAGPEARLILFAAENAEAFYQKLGFQLHERCYQLKPEELLR
jgi:ribosomal protein S18 acetylase RimI-like enzyme